MILVIDEDILFMDLNVWNDGIMIFFLINEINLWRNSRQKLFSWSF